MTKEIYRTYKDNIEVSNWGNVKKDGIVILPCMDKHYYYIVIKTKPIRVHTIVGELFQDICGEHKKNYHLHHKNRNQLDNRAENLIWLSPSEHRETHLKEDSITVPVKAYDLNGNYVGRWDSVLEAAKATGTDRRHISEIISGKQRRFTSKKLYWFKEEIPNEKISEIISYIQLSKKEAYSKIKKKK